MKDFNSNLQCWLVSSLSPYAKEAYVDAANKQKVSRASDVMDEELNISGCTLRNLPGIPQSWTGACGVCVTRDGSQGMRVNLDMGGKHITGVKTSINIRDATNKDICNCLA